MAGMDEGGGDGIGEEQRLSFHFSNNNNNHYPYTTRYIHPSSPTINHHYPMFLFATLSLLYCLYLTQGVCVVFLHGNY